MAHVLTVTVQGEPHSIDLERVTFAEARAIERVTGKDFGDVASTKSVTGVQALVWVAVKRDQPELKFSDLDDWAIADVEPDWQEDEPDPTTPAEVPAG